MASQELARLLGLILVSYTCYASYILHALQMPSFSFFFFFLYRVFGNLFRSRLD